MRKFFKWLSTLSCHSRMLLAGIQGLAPKSWIPDYTIGNDTFWITVFTGITVYMLLFSHPVPASANNWPGVDETVVEKIAKEHGRESQASLINTDQGDLLLFVFLIAGAIGGFAAGYYWRKLMEGKPNNNGTSS